MIEAPQPLQHDDRSLCPILNVFHRFLIAYKLRILKNRWFVKLESVLKLIELL